PRTSAVRANDVVHALGSRGGALGLGPAPTIGTALRLMEQALLRVELLLARGPHEGIAALAADQIFVGQRHRHSRAPPAESYAGQSSRLAPCCDCSETLTSKSALSSCPPSGGEKGRNPPSPRQTNQGPRSDGRPHSQRDLRTKSRIIDSRLAPCVNGQRLCQ